MAISVVNLPNGLQVECLCVEEVPILYQQVQGYLQHGVKLHPGDTVFDVGANIGLFSLWALEQCNRDLTIYAFEPIPATFEVLKGNAQRLAPNTMNVFGCGLAQVSGMVEFGYYPKATALSTAYPEDWKQARATIERAIKTALANPSPNDPADIRLLRRMPPVVRSFLLRQKLNQAFRGQRVHCPMRTISEIIRDQQVQRIDLLKVDVERSELNVLLGIEPQDWQKIQQVVVEVHNENQRVEQISALLRQHGLNQITIEQEHLLQQSNIFNLYAVRNTT